MNSNESIISVSLCCDQNVLIGLATTLSSIQFHLDKKWRVKFTILECGLSKEQRARIDRLVKSEGNGEIEWHDADALISELKLPVQAHLTKAAYGRLLLPNVLKNSRTIYLDCDVLVLDDLVKLWNEDLDSAVVGAVPDVGAYTIREGYPKVANLAANPDEVAFNSGVLLLDLEALRRGNYVSRFIDYALEHASELINLDQEVLNIVLSGSYKLFTLEWNLNLGWWGPKYRNLLPADFREINFRRPAIYHLAGGFKPWNSGLRHPAWAVFVKELWRNGYARPAEWVRMAPRMILPPKIQRWVGLAT